MSAPILTFFNNKLTPADGAVGSHAMAVSAARADFIALARKIAGRIGLNLSGEPVF